MTAKIRGFDRVVEVASRAPLDVPLANLIFLRHGETPRNALRLYQEPTEPLSDVGLAQARSAASVLAGAGISRIVASPMNRAATTARIVGAACGREPSWDDDLRERLFTALWGTSSADMNWAEDPAGCETLVEFVGRVRRGVVKATTSHRDGGSLLLVAHGGVLLALAAMLKIVPGEAMRANAQPIRFSRDGATWRADLLDAGVRLAVGEV